MQVASWLILGYGCGWVKSGAWNIEKSICIMSQTYFQQGSLISNYFISHSYFQFQFVIELKRTRITTTKELNLRRSAICFPYLAWDGIAEFSAEASNKAKFPQGCKCRSTYSGDWEGGTNTACSTWTDHTSRPSPSFHFLSNPLSLLLIHFHLRRWGALQLSLNTST